MKLPEFAVDSEFLINVTRSRFGEINNSDMLTDEDKKRLKEFFLEHFIAPKARELVRKYFQEESTDA